MVKGYIADYAGERVHVQSWWVEGEPVDDNFMNFSGSDRVDISGQEKFTVRSLRCEKCGFLESYAI